MSRKRRHQRFGKPYLHLRSVMRRALKAIRSPEPPSGHGRLEWAVAILDGIEMMSRQLE
jgi:hypothetical protein